MNDAGSDDWAGSDLPGLAKKALIPGCWSRENMRVVMSVEVIRTSLVGGRGERLLCNWRVMK